jgi:hypothetical protein
VHQDNYTKQKNDYIVCVSCIEEATHKLQTPTLKWAKQSKDYSSNRSHCSGVVVIILANFSEEELSVTKATLRHSPRGVRKSVSYRERTSSLEYIFGTNKNKEV